VVQRKRLALSRREQKPNLFVASKFPRSAVLSYGSRLKRLRRLDLGLFLASQIMSRREQKPNLFVASKFPRSAVLSYGSRLKRLRRSFCPPFKVGAKFHFKLWAFYVADQAA